MISQCDFAACPQVLIILSLDTVYCCDTIYSHDTVLKPSSVNNSSWKQVLSRPPKTAMGMHRGKEKKPFGTAVSMSSPVANNEAARKPDTQARETLEGKSDGA